MNKKKFTIKVGKRKINKHILKIVYMGKQGNYYTIPLWTALKWIIFSRQICIIRKKIKR